MGAGTLERIKALRGFRDIFGEEVDKFSLIGNISRKYLSLLGYREIDTPILEKTELFKRSIGDTTDIVEKEMFTFTDRNGESLSLRPEATAGIVRAYLQAGLYAKERTSKLFTVGPMFRHERPQKGRFRQFHQLNVEVFGISEPILDAEIIWLIHLILNELKPADYSIQINSVGCGLCRPDFRRVLVAYLEERKGKLCEDCIGRSDRNPLRIFDCKNEQCIDMVQEAPFLFDYLCVDCKKHFYQCLRNIEQFEVPVTVNKRLVRGLDYYTRTVFEVISESLGAQKTFLAGGRYDDLVEQMGGPSIPGCGFAIGMERLALLLDQLPADAGARYFLATVGIKAEQHIVPLLNSFIASAIQLTYSASARSLKSQMKHANSLGVDYVLILSDEEVARGVILCRNMKDGTQKELPLDPQTLPALLKTPG
jgi:histidyl-tRNA synthetase